MMQLGFLEFEVRDPAAWHGFLTEVLGLGATDAPGRYRMDGHAWRYQITAGPRDDLAAVGWEYDPEALPGMVEALQAAGHRFEAADPAPRSAAQRFVGLDPAGVPTELVSGLERAAAPFESRVVRGGFVGDALGLGHLVLTAPDPARSEAFYALLGLRLSDRIATTFHGHAVDLGFYHANPRHHSLAFGGPQRKRVNHFLVEATSWEEVGRAFDRTVRAGLRINQTLGRHPNDQMFSFYAQTPSRFQFEFGWGGLQIDPATWAPSAYDRISDWGHHPPALLPGSQP